MDDGRAGFVDGFSQGLDEALSRHKGVDAVDYETAWALGREAAAAAVAPLVWAEAVGERHDTTAVTRLLGVSRQAVAKRVAAGTLLGLRGRGTTHFPAWQFDVVTREVRPQVPKVVAAFREATGEVDALAIAAWANTPQDEDLDGSTPEAWILSGADDGVLVEAARRAAARLAA